ncbi:formylglycine-generating enzyme family protein [Burkholderia cepacia]|uniref:formylglycine-generating enzyme family protein n=1 Tax=Burkholderia cepacia TaxID=292 RepID=UPI000A547FEF|nr:formylglycine-generating enzyme family protein [Burkholderia cepacia]
MNNDKHRSCCPGAGKRQQLSAVSAHACASGIHSTGAGVPSNRDIVWFEAGKSWVGTDTPVIKADGEGPRRRVTLRAFGMDRYAVSNARFAEFVAATGYRTEAERIGWSYVFRLSAVSANHLVGTADAPWWLAIDGANWAAPEGPGSSLGGREQHPVVHVSWNDACAFAAWCGGRLPTEAEWEHAARGGAQARRYPWGDEEPSDEMQCCNIWHGVFPHLNTSPDGYAGTVRVDAFSPNPAGLYNCSGNVWEWCADPFLTQSLSSAGKARNRQALAEREHTLKGGSYLCHRDYCYRYRIAARTGRPRDTSTGHTGFRIAYDAAHE